MRLLILAVCSAMIACAPNPEDGETLGYKNRDLIITAVNPPKYFSVDVRDSDGTEYSGVAASKRCAHWQGRAVVGASYNIPFRLVRGDDGEVRSVMMERTLNDILCGDS